VTAIPINGPTVLPGTPPFTLEDLLEFPDDGNRYELFDGSLLVSPGPTPRHQRAVGGVLRVLGEAAPRGVEALPVINLRVTDQDVYLPDAVVVPAAAIRAATVALSPRDVTLTVEVTSPHTRVRDRVVKSHAYAAAGIPVYWRIEPEESPVLYVYELDGDSYGLPKAYEAGAVAMLSKPFPMSFDPAELVSPRR
jgi:Uma2 family endonuclease